MIRDNFFFSISEKIGDINLKKLISREIFERNYKDARNPELESYFLKFYFPDISDYQRQIILNNLRKIDSGINKFLAPAILSARYKGGDFDEFLREELRYVKKKALEVGVECGEASTFNDLSYETMRCILLTLESRYFYKFDWGADVENTETAVLYWYLEKEDEIEKLWVYLRMLGIWQDCFAFGNCN